MAKKESAILVAIIAVIGYYLTDNIKEYFTENYAYLGEISTYIGVRRPLEFGEGV